MSFIWMMLAVCSQAAPPPPSAPSHARGFCFTENLGQWDTPARFVGELGATLVRVEPQGIWLHQMGSRPGDASVLLRLSFEGASNSATVEGLRATASLHSYFIGNDPEKWIHAARSYEQVRLVGVYPGIDVVLGERNGVLKYDVHVAPQANLSQFVVRCEGADALCLEQDGGLRIEAGTEPLLSALGNAWEEQADGSRRTVYPRWRLLDGERFGIGLEGRDRSTALVIDPELSWATYLGSSSNSFSDGATAVAVADDGTVVAVGVAGDLSFPTTPGSILIAPPGESNLFVTKLAADGSSLIYSSIIGGALGQVAGGEVPRCVSLDGLGRAYVAGFVTSPTFPTTLGAFDRQFDGGRDGFALRLSSSGDALQYSTFLGGAQAGEDLYACVATPSGAQVVVGETASTDYPTTPNALQQVHKGSADVVVSRLSPDGSSLEWSTFMGGLSAERGLGVALADNEDVLITGWTNSQNFPTTPGTIEPVWQGSTFDAKAFITRLHSSGSSLVWSTFFGGPDESGPDGTMAYDIAVIPAGDVFIVGSVKEFTFPTTPGAFQTQFHYKPLFGLTPDGFLARFSPDGRALVFSTFLGTEQGEYAIGVGVDASGMATVMSACGDLPTTAGSFLRAAGSLNFGVSRFDPSGSRLIYSSLVGGPGYDSSQGMAMTPSGRVTLVGHTNGGFPVTPGSFDPTHNGGQFDAGVATLELFPTGVTTLGVSTPACQGPLILQSSEMPLSGSTSFSLMCSNAPPMSRGALLIGRAAQSQPIFIGGAALWVDPMSAWTRFIPVTSDMFGFVEVSLPLASVASGAQFAAQMLFRHRPQCLTQGLTCASQAITLDVQ